MHLRRVTAIATATRKELASGVRFEIEIRFSGREVEKHVHRASPFRAFPAIRHDGAGQAQILGPLERSYLQCGFLTA